MGAKLAGPAAGSRFNVEQNSEINVTPFVDVMLVLLIIFMVAAPLATVSVTLTLPEAIAPVTPNPAKPVYISIQQSGNIYVGDFPTSVDSLGEDLRTQIGTRNPEKERIFIRADRQTVYRDFMRVMNTLQDNGFYSVALIGTEGRS
jgi:biopolymer transport protein ExbD